MSRIKKSKYVKWGLKSRCLDLHVHHNSLHYPFLYFQIVLLLACVLCYHPPRPKRLEQEFIARSTFPDDYDYYPITEKHEFSPEVKEVRSIANQQPFSANLPLPWKCELNASWEFLGLDHRPSFIRNGSCANTTCWYGHYHCQPLTYTVEVLKTRAEEYNLDHRSMIPNELEAKWSFISYNVTVACVCDRI